MSLAVHSQAGFPGNVIRDDCGVIYYYVACAAYFWPRREVISWPSGIC